MSPYNWNVLSDTASGQITGNAVS